MWCLKHIKMFQICNLVLIIWSRGLDIAVVSSWREKLQQLKNTIIIIIIATILRLVYLVLFILVLLPGFRVLGAIPSDIGIPGGQTHQIIAGSQSSSTNTHIQWDKLHRSKSTHNNTHYIIIPKRMQSIIYLSTLTAGFFFKLCIPIPCILIKLLKNETHNYCSNTENPI